MKKCAYARKEWSQQVYVEDRVEELFQTILGLCGKKSVVLLGYEFRSKSVDTRLHDLFQRHFDVKQVPKSKVGVPA